MFFILNNLQGSWFVSHPGKRACLHLQKATVRLYPAVAPGYKALEQTLMESILQVLSFFVVSLQQSSKITKMEGISLTEKSIHGAESCLSFVLKFFVSVSKIDKFIDIFCTAVPNSAWNMNLKSNAALCSLSTCKILEILTTIRILIKYILRNLFYAVPVFKKCLFFSFRSSAKSIEDLNLGICTI